MCGFSGFTNPRSNEMAESLLNNMLKPIKHRGPDSNAIFINNKIALGHYRLSIIDLKGGMQPFKDEEENNYLVFNGEIYGYKNHAKLLTKYGIKLRDNSDTEVLFQSLIYFGVEKTLKMIDGMFAFAFYEAKKDLLWLVRDPMGEKPLYYSNSKNKTYFSSEVSGLAAVNKNYSSNINNNAVIQYLHLDYIPNDQSLLCKVNKVMPGEIIKICNSKVIKSTYFSLDLSQKKGTTFKESVNSLDSLLEKAVDERLLADVPVGVFLSTSIYLLL